MLHVDGLGHGVHDGEHHGGGGCVGDPHGEEHGGEHEAQHEPGLAGADHHDDPEGHPVVEAAVLHRDSHDQAAQELHGEGDGELGAGGEGAHHVVGAVEVINGHFLGGHDAQQRQGNLKY